MKKACLGAIVGCVIIILLDFLPICSYILYFTGQMLSSYLLEPVVLLIFLIPFYKRLKQ